MLDASRAVDAEAALAWAHAEPQAAADVVEIGGAAVPHRLLEPPAPDQLALTYELLVLERLLAPPEPRAEAHVLPILGAGWALVLRAARPLGAELAAHRVD